MTRPWWQDAVVYQIYPRSFADSNGDGVGDLRGIIDRVDHIAELGVDAVWLSPIFRSPMADHGYDVADYCEVDPVFGTNDDLDDLVTALHDRGRRLLLDWVPNHTSDQHPWFVESRSSRDNPKRDWYVWRDRRPDGSPPSNWRAAFSDVPAWTHDDATDQSYLHLFLPEQPDLNWANPEVEAAMHDTLRFWLDRGVDGFRADVVHLIGKGTDVDDLPENEAKAPVISVDRPEGHERLRRIRTLLDSYAHDPMMVGEVYLLGPGETASYLGDPDRGRGELHLSFDFRPLHTPWDAAALHAAITTTQTEFPEGRWPTWVLSNHDQTRHRSRYGTDARARAAAVLSLTMRGTPFLYAGEELGLTDADVPPDRQVDPAGRRDGCRAPIPWTTDGDAETGHGWPTMPWLPFPTNAATNAADAQVNDPDSVLALYRRLLQLRRGSTALRAGTMTLAPLDGDVLRYRRSAGDEHVDVVVNLGTDPVAIPTHLDGRVVIRTSGHGDELIAPDEAIVAI
ncbi:MAG: alpha-amylase family glycosyl hydrolase [Acidimicrobiales bacterium]|nr:alpha-amylase family glycosyl hydrolase [Acidimicrobiales bacterium]